MQILNPANRAFFIESEEQILTYSLTSSLGVSVLSAKANILPTNYVEIETLDLPSGMYYIEIQTGIETHLRKIIIQ